MAEGGLAEVSVGFDQTEDVGLEIADVVESVSELQIVGVPFEAIDVLEVNAD